VEPDRELILEDARSIREGLWRMAQLVQDAAESLDARIENEDLDGATEATELREALERVQDLSLEISEELVAYQGRHAR
jgi:phosphate uptake regulator